MNQLVTALLLCLVFSGGDVAAGLSGGDVMAGLQKFASLQHSETIRRAPDELFATTKDLQESRFATAKRAWLRRYATTRHCKEYVPSAFMKAQPEICPGNVARLGHLHEDGGWNLCDHEALRRPGCVSYLFGAGYDISFDISMALEYPQCEIYTIDPTPGLKRHLSTLKGVLSMLPRRPDLTAKLQALGAPPKNWHHVNVGIHSSGAVQQWGNAGKHNFWTTGRLFRGTSGTVHLLPLHAIMERLGHRRVNVVKIDVEGAEWDVYPHLINRSIGVHQLMIELHGAGPGRESWLKFYHEMMRSGFTLFAQEPTRYSNAVADIGRKRDRIWRHSDARLHNFTRGCEHPLGEFSFFRELPAANLPAVWRYTDAAYQDEEE